MGPLFQTGRRPCVAAIGELPLWSVAGESGSVPEEEPREERCAFEARMQAAWPGVIRLVGRLLAWPDTSGEVEDVAQETFLAAWTGRHTFRGDAEWTTWIHTIAVRRARNAARSRDRRLRWFGSLRGDSELSSADEPLEEQSGRELRAVLQRLRHADREVLVLRYLEELSVEEIAGHLALRRAAVDARLSRARARMKAAMEAAGRGERIE